MDANDIDLARDVFVDLVITWTTHHRQPPDSVKAQTLAVEAIGAARSFNSARLKDYTIPTSPAGDTPSGLPLRGGTVTLTRLIRDWGTRIVSRSAGHNGRNLISRLDRYVVPYLGNRPISALQSAEILSVLRGIENLGFRPLAYQIYRDLRSMFRYAQVAGLCTRDPTVVVGSFIRRPRTQRSAGIFQPERLGRLLVAIRSYRGKVRSTAQYMFRLAPILFLRAVELRELQWREVDLDAATLVISPARMKSRRVHIVPLPTQAVRILKDVQKITGGLRFVFNGGRGRDRPPTYSAFFQMLRRVGYARTVTPQGFRAMASTWLNEQGWRADAIEKQLSHAGDGGHLTRRIYNRAEYLAERRKMMQAWADYLEGVESRTLRSLREAGFVEGKVWREGATDVAIRH
jgi:integrase